MNQDSEELFSAACCVCGKKEERDETFQACPKCVELNIISEVFCSEECFRSAWDEHKQIHEIQIDLTNVTAQDPSTKKYFSETIEELIPKLKKYRKETGETMTEGVETKAVELYMEGQRAFNQHDFNTAETKLRKHIKKAPFFGSNKLALPNAFYMLGQMYRLTRTREAAAYLEKGAQTAARMLFMNEVYGHTYDNSPYHALHSDNIPRDIMDIINYALTMIMSYNTIDESFFEADWALNDHKFKKLIRYSIQLYQKHEISKGIKHDLYRFNAYALFFMGQVSQGKNNNTYKNTVRCVADLKEALEWQKKVVLLSSGEVQPNYPLTSLVATLDTKKFPILIEDYTIEKDDVEIYDGRWVTINGLTSQIGQSMNGKIALVKGNQVNGHFPVVLKKDGTPSLIKIEHLKPYEMTEEQEVIVILLPPDEQWTYMSMLYTFNLWIDVD